MQNKKRFCLVLCLVALLVVGSLCLAACTKKDTRSIVTFEGVEEIHAPVGTVTEESLLAGVTAVDANGKKQDVTVDLGGADFSKPGRYLIEYKSGNNIKREAVYLYGDISFQVNGKALESSEVEVDFATAINSLHFAKIASATDSFGNAIDATLVEGDKFDYSAGTYTVKYSATDKAGQTVEKTVTYTVTSSIEMTVQSGVSVKYEQESVKFKVDLDGEKDIWLMANGGLVSIADYVITDEGLEVKSSYYRTLPAGENTLKLCSVNGSTEFTFTVVDTGKPLFTFDSIYKSNIITGSPVVYKMPKAQIAGHEYSYSFKVTKDGVSYKAEQRGNNLLITTSSGKNLPAGIYEITVTATNKADTSKKTTIKRDFRVYSNQTEIDGWKFANDGNGSSLVNVDLSDEGYYRTSWLYTAKSPNSWNNRLMWVKATKATFQTITFDFKVTSLGIAEKENGPVKYVGKNDLATIPLSCSTMSGEGIAMMFFDQNGKVVDMSELKMNTWYTVKLDVSEILHPKSESTDMMWYFGVSNKWQATMYIADMNFWTYEGAGVQNVYKDADKTVSLQRNGGKSNLTSATVDGESVIRYTVTDKHMPSTPIKRALKVTLADKSKEVVSIDFKYNSEPKNVSGEALAPTMFVHDVDYRNDGVFGANFAIVDENGNPVVDIEVGKWYTLWITTEGRQNYLIYPMGEISEQITCDISFKNLKSYDYDLGIAKMVAGYAKVAHVSLYKNNEDKWGYSYTSYTGWHTDANTAWNRRPLIKVEEGVTEVRFRFKFDVSEYIPVDTTESVKNLQLWAALESASGPTLVTTIMDEEFNEVAAGEREVGVWYTAFVTRADGGALPTTFNLLPGGYADGGKGTIVNLDIEFTDLKGYKSTEPVTITNPDNNISITGTTLSQEENSTVIKHVLVEENAPYSPANKAIALTVLDETKQVISMKFTVNKMNSIEDEPMPAWVRVETKTGYDGNYVVIDENGDACKYVEAGKTYTLFITRPEFVKAAGGLYGQSDNPTEFSIYLTGKNGPQFADVDITEMKLHEVTEATTENGGLTYQTKLIHGNATYYEYDGKWNIAYTSHYSLYRGSPTATDNSAENREFFVTHNGENAVQLRFKLRFVEGTANGVPEVGFIAAGQTISFYKDGALVTNREAGVWYDVIITKGSENISDSFTIYGGAYNNNYPVDFQYQIADLQVMTPEDFPDIMVTTSTSIGAAVWQYTEADGWHWFIPNNGVNIAAEHRQAIVTLPEDGMYKLTYEVKFNEVTGDGLPYMGLMQGVNKYYDLETGEYVGSGNGCLLETGKWYKVEYATNNQANMGTTPWTFAYIGGFGVGNASLSIRNVEATGATKYTVDFNLNYEGAEDAPASISVREGQGYGTLPAPKRENYRFGGWYLNAECTGNAVTSTTAVTQAHTLYAKWIANDAPVVEFATPGEFADPVMAVVDGKIVYTINGSANDKVASAQRKLTVAAIDGNVTEISFEFKLSNLDGVTANISSPDAALLVKFYDAAGAEVTTLTADAWFKMVITKADGSALGTSAWEIGYLGGKGKTSGKLDVEIRNAKVFPDANESVNAEVSFNLNYEGAEDAPATVDIEKGQAYGTLPKPNRDGYTFIGWYLNAECTGEAVNAETTVSESHTLYAKWEEIIETDVPDTNPIVVQNNADYNPNNAKLIHTLVNGEHLYTYTTKGVASPTESAWGRRLNITFTAGQQEYVIVEFRFTEAYAEDGVTAFAPSIGVYSHNEGNGGSWISTIDILDATGKRVTGSNNKDGLTVGQWYTLVVGVKENTDVFEIWTAHNASDKAILTMEVRERAGVNSSDMPFTVGTSTTATGYYGKVTPAISDGKLCYRASYHATGDPTNHIDRRVYLYVDNANGDMISMKVCITEVNKGTPRILIGSNSTSNEIPSVVKDENGNLVANDAMEVGKWYTISWNADGAERYQIQPFNGSAANGSFVMKDIEVTEGNIGAVVTFNLNGAEGTAPATIQVAAGAAYGTLPTPTREGYTFGGWYKDAECTGNAVVATDTVTGSHTLYAKWIDATPDPEVPSTGDTNPVVVEDNANFNPNNAIMTHTFDGEKHLYTYTTRGVNIPTSSPYGRRAKISFPAGQQEFVVLEFRYTEAYAADGVTEIAPSLGVYSHNEGNGGSWISSINIYDMEGNRVTGSNEVFGLTVGQWYLLVVGVKSNTDYIELWTAHSYSTDAPILTMEIGNRAAYGVGTRNYSITYPDFGAYYSTVSNALDLQYGALVSKCVVNSRGDGTNEIDRRVYLNVEAKKGQVIGMQVMITETTGTPTMAISNKESVLMDYVIIDEEGTVVNDTAMELNKLYTIMWFADGSESYQIRPFSGKAANGTYYVYNVGVIDLISGASNAYYLSPSFALDDGGFVKIGVNSKGDPTNSWDRRIELFISNEAGNKIVTLLQITETTGTPCVTIHNASGTLLEATITDIEGNPADMAAMEIGKWYLISWTADGSANYQIRPFDGSGANGTIQLADIAIISAE